MNKLSYIPLLLISIFTFTSCGKRVEVPPGYTGFIKDKDGIHIEAIKPSFIRLPVVAPWGVKSSLLMSETSRFVEIEDFSIFMPKDNLIMDIEIRASYMIPRSSALEVIEENPSRSYKNQERVMAVSASEIYRKYSEQIVNSRCRAILTKFTIQEILDKQDELSPILFDAVSEGLSKNKAPIRVVELNIGKVSPPEVIINAQIKTKEREIAIKEAEAQREVRLTDAETELQEAKKKQEVELIEAETQFEVEQILSKSVNAQFVTQRSLKSLQSLAENPNKTIILLPMEAMSNPAMLIGATEKALKNNE